MYVWSVSKHILYKLPILPFCSQVFRGNGPISVHHARREGVLEPSNLSGPTGAVFWLSEAERGDPRQPQCSGVPQEHTGTKGCELHVQVTGKGKFSREHRGHQNRTREQTPAEKSG